MKETRHSKESFSLKDFLKALTLGLLLSSLDMVSDFIFADSLPPECDLPLRSDRPPICGDLKKSETQALTYMFIAAPFLFLTASRLQLLLQATVKKYSNGFSHSNVAICITNFITPAIVVFGLTGLYFLSKFVTPFGFILAILSAIFILGVKILALFVHGPEMKKFVIRVTAAESLYESSFQLLLVIWVFLGSGEWNTAGLVSGSISFLVIGKASAESFISIERMDNQKPLWCPEKIRNYYLLAVHSQVFAFMALFRVGSIALIFTWARLNENEHLIYLVVYSTLTLALPIVTLLLLKLCILKDLGVGRCIEGCFAELVNTSMWKPRSKHGTKISIVFAIYFLLLNCAAMIWIICDPRRWFEVDPEVELEKQFGKEWIEGRAYRLQISAIICLIDGCFSFTLFLFSPLSFEEDPSVEEKKHFTREDDY